jgi:hypothetical protein
MTPFMLFQLILFCFALFVLTRIFRQYRAKKVSATWCLLWALFWLVVIFTALSPQTTDVLARLVGVERGADLAVYLAIAFLFYALFRITIRLDEQREELTKLVRKMAIDDATKNYEDSSCDPSLSALSGRHGKSGI